MAVTLALALKELSGPRLISSLFHPLFSLLHAIIDTRLIHRHGMTIQGEL